MKFFFFSYFLNHFMSVNGKLFTALNVPNTVYSLQWSYNAVKLQCLTPSILSSPSVPCN